MRLRHWQSDDGFKMDDCIESAIAILQPPTTTYIASMWRPHYLTLVWRYTPQHHLTDDWEQTLTCSHSSSHVVFIIRRTPSPKLTNKPHTRPQANNEPLWLWKAVYPSPKKQRPHNCRRLHNRQLVPQDTTKGTIAQWWLQTFALRHITTASHRTSLI